MQSAGRNSDEILNALRPSDHHTESDKLALANEINDTFLTSLAKFTTLSSESRSHCKAPLWAFSRVSYFREECRKESLAIRLVLQEINAYLQCSLINIRASQELANGTTD